MTWYEMFPKEKEPRDEQIKDYVSNPLWDTLAGDLTAAYNVKPKLSYSGCSMDGGAWMGWNVKYKKSGKALCTLYPKQDYFVALVAVGAKEQNEADLLAPLCGDYARELYNRSRPGHMGRSLAFEVTSEEILRDMEKFIALRVA